jgi:hypothetical protein
VNAATDRPDDCRHFDSLVIAAQLGEVRQIEIFASWLANFHDIERERASTGKYQIKQLNSLAYG